MANVDYILKLSEEFRKIINPFDIRKFDLLPVFDERNLGISDERKEMLSKILLIGHGGSRNTYAISSKKALKVAKNERGIQGNRNEFENLNKYHSVWLPKAFRKANNYSWIEVELVRPINNIDEIKNLIGIDGDLFIRLLEKRSYKSTSFNDAIDELIIFYQKMIKSYHARIFDKDLSNKISKLQSYINNKYLIELDDFLNESGIESGELILLENWGMSSARHLVMLDIGELKGEYG